MQLLASTNRILYSCKPVQIKCFWSGSVDIHYLQSKPASHVHNAHVNKLNVRPPSWPLLQQNAIYTSRSFHHLSIQISSGSNISFLIVFLFGVCSSPADLQAPVEKGLRLARHRPLLVRWAAASRARRLRPLWPLQSSPPSTPLETLRLQFQARSESDMMFYNQCVQEKLLSTDEEHFTSIRFCKNSGSFHLSCGI